MATPMNITKVWQYDDSAFTFEDKETPGTFVTMQPINVGFDDDSLGVVYAPEDKALEYMQALQLIEGCQAEFTLEVPAKPKTAKGQQKWKITDFPGKGKSKLRILSDVPGDDSPGTTQVGTPAGDGGSHDEAPVALSSEPRDPGSIAQESDWAYAREVFSCGVNAPVLVALALTGWSQEKPPSEDNVTIGDLDGLIEKRLAGQV